MIPSNSVPDIQNLPVFRLPEGAGPFTNTLNTDLILDFFYFLANNLELAYNLLTTASKLLIGSSELVVNIDFFIISVH